MRRFDALFAAALLVSACGSDDPPGADDVCPLASVVGVYQVTADASSPTDCTGQTATVETSLPPSAYFSVVAAGADAVVFFCTSEADCRACTAESATCAVTFTGLHIAVAPSFLGNANGDGCGEFEGGYASYDATASNCKVTGLVVLLTPKSDGTATFLLGSYERDLALTPTDCADLDAEDSTGSTDLSCVGSETLTATRLPAP